MKINITITQPSSPPIIPPEISGKRYFILHDWQSAETGYQIYREYLPETEKFGYVTFEKMYEERQWFWYNLMKFYGGTAYTEEEMRKKWRYITAGNLAFCNKHGTHNNPRNPTEYWDFINNEGTTETPPRKKI